MRTLKFLFVISFLILLHTSLLYAKELEKVDDSSKYNPNRWPVNNQDNNGPVEERVKKEKRIPPDFFAIVFYKPTYLLPYYYTGAPYNKIYVDNTPNNEKINRQEMKYQLSFKVPIWKSILHRPSTLYLAYTQLSYWQAYNRTAFFRSTDYEPELFIANEINLPFLLPKLHFNFLNIGAVHQSNGFGSNIERSWNRIYLEAISSNDCWMVSIKPWYIVQDSTLKKYNPDIANYLGYGQILIAYKYYHQVFSLLMHNVVEMGGRHATGELTWSFPISSYLDGYVQIFSGYGQSLIEYDHRTNSAGIGIALSNWA